jgi:hypothetical protein
VNYPSFAPKLQYTVGSKVISIAYAIDGKPVTTVTSAPWTPPLRVPKSIDKSGTHTLQVTLTDQYYNVVTAQVTFNFSTTNTGPDIRLTSPEVGAQVTNGLPILMRAESGDPSNIKYVEFFIDTQLITRKPIAPYELTYPANLSAGTHFVRAVATDLSGNSAEDQVQIEVK